jgi:hypothetical protein
MECQDGALTAICAILETSIGMAIKLAVSNAETDRH